MFRRVLDWLGFRKTVDVWAENERLRKAYSDLHEMHERASKQLAAEQANVALARRDVERLRGKRIALSTQYKDACLRIIEIEGEVNELCKTIDRPNRYPAGGGQHGS